MNGKKAKKIRKEGRKRFDIFIGKLLDLPFKYRLKVAWTILRGRGRQK